MSLIETLGTTESAIAEFCGRRGIVELAVFGSSARGEIRATSDVDLLATFRPDARWDLFDLVEMQDELGELFGRRIDLVERGTIRNPYRRRSIMRDATTVYAA